MMNDRDLKQWKAKGALERAARAAHRARELEAVQVEKREARDEQVRQALLLGVDPCVLAELTDLSEAEVVALEAE